jgi:hypothetical protein
VLIPTSSPRASTNLPQTRAGAPGHVAAATSVYGLIAEQGPAAVLATPSPEKDATTIARANELLRTNPDTYCRDQGLQELALEARERQQAAPPPEPGIDHDAIERRIAQHRFAAMLRQPAEAANYWASAESPGAPPPRHCRIDSAAGCRASARPVRCAGMGNGAMATGPKLPRPSSTLLDPEQK